MQPASPTGRLDGVEDEEPRLPFAVTPIEHSSLPIAAAGIMGCWLLHSPAPAPSPGAGLSYGTARWRRCMCMAAAATVVKSPPVLRSIAP